MNEYFRNAEYELTKVRDKINRILDNDGEDISCFNPCALDELFLGLARTRSFMACGRLEDKDDGK